MYILSCINCSGGPPGRCRWIRAVFASPLPTRSESGSLHPVPARAGPQAGRGHPLLGAVRRRTRHPREAFPGCCTPSGARDPLTPGAETGRRSSSAVTEIDHFRESPADIKIGQKLQKGAGSRIMLKLVLRGNINRRIRSLYLKEYSLFHSFGHLYWVSLSKLFCCGTGKMYL